MRDPAVTDLMTLLDAEAKAILAGRYSVLDDLAARKTALFDALQREPSPPGDLRRIARLLARNQAILAAAIRGIGAARVRLADMRAVRDGLQVYDESGRFASASVARPDLVKKA